MSFFLNTRSFDTFKVFCLKKYMYVFTVLAFWRYCVALCKYSRATVYCSKWIISRNIYRFPPRFHVSETFYIKIYFNMMTVVYFNGIYSSKAVWKNPSHRASHLCWVMIPQILLTWPVSYTVGGTGVTWFSSLRSLHSKCINIITIHYNISFLWMSYSWNVNDRESFRGFDAWAEITKTRSMWQMGSCSWKKYLWGR